MPGAETASLGMIDHDDLNRAGHGDRTERADFTRRDGSRVAVQTMAATQALKEIRIGSSDVTSTNFSIYYAKDRKLFQKEGLDPKMIIVKAEAILAALSAGELGYTTFSTSAIDMAGSNAAGAGTGSGSTGAAGGSRRISERTISGRSLPSSGRQSLSEAPVSAARRAAT